MGHKPRYCLTKMSAYIFSIAFVVVFADCVLATKNPCPEHWAYYDGNCFYFSIHSAERWDEAQQICRQNHNSHLVTIDNEVKNDFIRGILEILVGDQRVHWVGGTDSLSEGIWTWVESDSLIGPYTHWGPGYPQNATSSHDCMVTNLLNGQLIWRDRPCNLHYNYICEFRAPEIDGSIVGK